MRERPTETFPSLTARKHWVKYAAGMLTETAFISVLTIVGLLLALAAKVIWP